MTGGLMPRFANSSPIFRACALPSGGQHRFTSAISACVPSERITACWLRVTHQHYKICFGPELSHRKIVCPHMHREHTEKKKYCNTRNAHLPSR